MKRIISVSLILTLSLILIYTNIFNKKDKKNLATESDREENTYNSNLLENIQYIAKDEKGNEYTIYAQEGEIDLEDKEVIFLKKVRSVIKLKNSDEVTITSNFGKYNSSNYDTIFSKNVIINYLDNEINSEYLDFSLLQNRMIISKNIVFTNSENILKADVIEMDVKTKDTKIYMHEVNKKVNLKNKNYTDGNN